MRVGVRRPVGRVQAALPRRDLVEVLRQQGGEEGAAQAGVVGQVVRRVLNAGQEGGGLREGKGGGGRTC